MHSSWNFGNPVGGGRGPWGCHKIYGGPLFRVLFHFYDTIFFPLSLYLWAHIFSIKKSSLMMTEPGILLLPGKAVQSLVFRHWSVRGLDWKGWTSQCCSKDFRPNSKNFRSSLWDFRLRWKPFFGDFFRSASMTKPLLDCRCRSSTLSCRRLETFSAVRRPSRRRPALRKSDLNLRDTLKFREAEETCLQMLRFGFRSFSSFWPLISTAIATADIKVF